MERGATGIWMMIFTYIDKFNKIISNEKDILDWNICQISLS